MRVRDRFDHGTVRSAGFVALLTVVFLVTNTAVAAAADGSSTGGGLLGPLDIVTREGVPLSSYQLDSSVQPASAGLRPQNPTDLIGGSVLKFDVIGETQRLLLSGLFTLVRLLVGLCCWLIGFVFDFPLLRLLTDPAQRLADAYQRHVVDALGLEGLLLAWAFVFGLVLFVRGKVGKGLGEIVLTLVIAALAASAFVRPDYMLGEDGPLQQTHQAAIEVASITTASYFDTPARGGRPCDTAVGPAHDACVAEQADAKTVTTPIQAALTDALVVKPYMLLQYGRILDPKKEGEKAAYGAHLKWVSGNAPAPPPKLGENDPCAGLDGPSTDYCESAQPKPSKEDNCELLITPAKEYCEKAMKGEGAAAGGDGFPGLIKNLNNAGPVGKSAAAYAEKPSWDRVWAVLALLVAVVVVALMVVSMSVVMLGAQGADAAAAAGGPIAWVWAMLPGPSRMLLWRWLGVFVVSALVAFMAAMALPLFGIAVDAILADSGADQMMERLLLLDALAVGFLVLHRRILRATAGFGQRMATRMRYAKVGGSHLPGDNSELGAALAMHGAAPGGGSGGPGGRASVTYGAFGARLRSLGSLAALSDGTGMPMNPGRLLGDAVAEGRRGIAPLAIALRAAHTALVGPPPGRHPAAARLHAFANGTAAGRPGGGEMVVDEWTGEILHDPETDRPLLGSRIHARAGRLRGYRIASRAARVTYGATLGLPRNLSAVRSAASEFTTDAHTQLRVASHRVREDGGRWMRTVDHAGMALATAWQVHDPVGAARRTALAAAMHAVPSSRTPAGRPNTGVSARRTNSRRSTTPPTPATPPAPSAPAGGGISPSRGRPARDDRAQAPEARLQGAGRASTEDQERADAAANAARLRSVFEARAAARRRREEGAEARPQGAGQASTEDQERADAAANAARLRSVFEARAAAARRRREEGEL
ncbi:hypothetical protein OG818_40710 [Streptomyces virginiae]|uniref:hypothetical protein n=1 Tax=Streptomyces virginiae TaxID=1961 RepID=UPI002258631C|nr:hypothetical protein [Streptomyces virginiae]MCX4722016.1 hypothetical protein [Streptomyces virginiae]